MKLLTLEIRNFQRHQALDVIPGGNCMAIYGDNYLGKSTIADAYFWLLFGKNLSESSNFDIYPHEAPDGVEPSVRAVFKRADGTTFSLRRTTKKNFARKKGEAAAEFKGNVQEFYIDEIPKKAGEYKAFIDSLGGEGWIMLLTDPGRFAGKTKWQDRRKLLLETFAADMSERDVIERNKELHPLLEHVGAAYSVKDVADRKNASRKEINQKLKDIPGRIDECVRMRPELLADSSPVQMGALAKQRIELRSKIDNIRSGVDIGNTKALISNLEANIAEERTRYIKASSGGDSHLEEQCMVLRRSILNAKDAVMTLEGDVKSYHNQIEATNTEMDDLRKKWHTENEKKFDAAACPYCNRPYPPEDQEKAKADFNLHKAEALKEINAKGAELKEIAEGLKVSVADKEKQLGAEKARLPLLQEELNKLQASIVAPPDFETTEKYKVLSEKLAGAKAKLVKLQEHSEVQVAALQEKLDELDRVLHRSDEIQHIKEDQAKADARIAELKSQEKKLGTELAQVENILFLCERFTQVQADNYEEEINRHFSKVRWKLFERQINGGIVAICEATYGGTEYNNTLNPAGKVHAGLDIINTFTKVKGESWPVIIDNAEGITSYDQIPEQTIWLYVSKSDKKLRMEAIL